MKLSDRVSLLSNTINQAHYVEYHFKVAIKNANNELKEKVAAKYQSSIDHLEKEKEHFSKLDDQYSYNIACDEITQWKQAISILNETTNE